MHVFDFTPEDIARLTAAHLWHLYGRSRSRMWSAAPGRSGSRCSTPSCVTIPLAGRATVVISPRCFSLRRVTRLAATFRAEIAALRKQLPSGPQPKEILASFGGVWSGWRVSATPGCGTGFACQRRKGRDRSAKYPLDDDRVARAPSRRTSNASSLNASTGEKHERRRTG